ncbi:hypothetical protein [Leifsonia aquatica]|uniref:hypothetical protein n=1 Tax=Leifsonia aquatica TaxID=144185 RepID=UPI000468476E|nr:hypothetical protein [Leifsonia aquatica]
MSYATKAHPKLVTLDEEVRRRHREMDGDHFPDRPAYGRPGGTSVAKWACGNEECDYWTGYATRAKANRMILQHCDAKNTSPRI